MCDRKRGTRGQGPWFPRGSRGGARSPQFPRPGVMHTRVSQAASSRTVCPSSIYYMCVWTSITPVRKGQRSGSHGIGKPVRSRCVTGQTRVGVCGARKQFPAVGLCPAITTDTLGAAAYTHHWSRCTHHVYIPEGPSPATPQPWIQDVSKVTLGALWSVEEEVEVTTVERSHRLIHS